MGHSTDREFFAPKYCPACNDHWRGKVTEIQGYYIDPNHTNQKTPATIGSDGKITYSVLCKGDSPVPYITCLHCGASVGSIECDGITVVKTDHFDGQSKQFPNVDGPWGRDNWSQLALYIPDTCPHCRTEYMSKTVADHPCVVALAFTKAIPHYQEWPVLLQKRTTTLANGSEVTRGYHPVKLDLPNGYKTEPHSGCYWWEIRAFRCTICNQEIRLTDGLLAIKVPPKPAIPAMPAIPTSRQPFYFVPEKCEGCGAKLWNKLYAVHVKYTRGRKGGKTHKDHTAVCGHTDKTGQVFYAPPSGYEWQPDTAIPVSCQACKIELKNRGLKIIQSQPIALKELLRQRRITQAERDCQDVTLQLPSRQFSKGCVAFFHEATGDLCFNQRLAIEDIPDFQKWLTAVVEGTGEYPTQSGSTTEKL